MRPNSAAWPPGAGRRTLAAEANTTLDLVAPPDPYKIVLPVLPQEVGSLRLPEGASGDRAEWHRRLLKLRQDQAAALFALARRSVRRHQASLAYRLALDAIQANPDHEAARRVFGYQKYQNQWHTPFEVQMLRSGMVWHEKFGWIEKANLPRYEPASGSWASPGSMPRNDAKLHAEITTGWDIETEHYRIRTNHSIEAAVALGVKLENLHRLWRQIFLGYYASEADIEALFSGRPLPQLGFAAAGRGLLPQQRAVPSGLDAEHARRRHLDGPLCGENHTAYFYAGSEDSERTSITRPRQLFRQSRQRRRRTTAARPTAG